MADGASVVIFNKSGKRVLLVKRRDVPLWNLPGGTVEPGETQGQAAIRETEEETGLKVKLIRKVGVWKNFKTSGTNAVYLSKIISGRPRLGPETAEIRFFPLKSLPDSFLSHFRARIIAARSGTKSQFFPANYSIFELLSPLLKHPPLLTRVVIWYLLRKYFKGIKTAH